MPSMFKYVCVGWVYFKAVPANAGPSQVWLVTLAAEQMANINQLAAVFDISVRGTGVAYEHKVTRAARQ